MSKKIEEPRSSALEMTGSQELLGYKNGGFTVLLSCVLKKQSFSFQLIEFPSVSCLSHSPYFTFPI